ncbi:hypothetical protein SAMN03159343_1600 [Klenkia marina]|uniref:DUF998 domain-containing protein n=1 Tax=Klenkia marina TaxID=1960309 RepID=A0A1G4XY14_9ACTN|nr:hypothetical protein [Klenkia marina]SCX45498.1 hypothetical protein SAMN03159343_1600 [Klenkia marina]
MPLVGWSVVLAAALLSVLLTDDSVWGRGVLADGGEITATQGVLVGLPDYQATIILTFAGLGTAVFFGLAAVPGSRASRRAVAALVVVLAAAGVVATLAVDDGGTPEEKVGGAVISLVPAALLLVLVLRRVRRTSAAIACGAVTVALVAHVVTLARLLGSDGSPALGAWLMAVLLLLGLAGSLVVLRSVSRLSPVRPG